MVGKPNKSGFHCAQGSRCAWPIHQNSAIDPGFASGRIPYASQVDNQLIGGDDNMLDSRQNVSAQHVFHRDVLRPDKASATFRMSSPVRFDRAQYDHRYVCLSDRFAVHGAGSDAR
jgi:hypothetical protein